MITLIEGNSHEFFGVPFRAYPKETLYVSPLKDELIRSLDPLQNPLFLTHGEGTFFTVRRKGVPVGRISVQIHTASNTYHGTKQCFFGFFDCANDAEAATLLLESAETFARKRGMTEIIGNFNLTAMQALGIVTDGFEHAPYTGQVYNPSHIPDLLEANGYMRTFPTRTFDVDLAEADSRLLSQEKVKQRVREEDIEWRQLQKKNFKPLMRDACDVLNASFSDRPMFVPMNHDEFLFQTQDMRWSLDSRLSFLAYESNQPVAVMLCMPDTNPLLHKTRSRVGLTTPWHYMRHRKQGKRASIICTSVIPEFRRQGIATTMLVRLMRALKGIGYERMGMSWVGDDNEPMLRLVETLRGRPHHRLHLFRKVLA